MYIEKRFPRQETGAELYRADRVVRTKNLCL